MSAPRHFFGRQSIFWPSMNTLVAGASLCSLVLIAGRAAIDDQPQRVLAEADNEDAMWQLDARIDAAWNAGDADTFADQWSADDTVTNPMGQTSARRTDIETDFAAELVYLKGTTHTLTISSNVLASERGHGRGWGRGDQQRDWSGWSSHAAIDVEVH